MTTTTILDAQGCKRSEGKNLAIVARYANGRGVKSVTVEKSGAVTVLYKGGWSATVEFADYSHACDWARKRSAASSRASWFAGCEVILKD